MPLIYSKSTSCIQDVTRGLIVLPQRENRKCPVFLDSSRLDYAPAIQYTAPTSIVGVAGLVAAQSNDQTIKEVMRTRKIPHTDLNVSRIAYGCAMIGLDWNSPEFVAKAVPVIRAAYDHGISFFDLADAYASGKSEMALGEVLKKSPQLRNEIVIQTKCGERRPHHGINNSRDYILSSAEGSLKRLGTDRIDIFLLHWPDSLVEPDEVASAFDELKRRGKVRFFGVSNHSPEQIELLKRSVQQPIVVAQIQLGLAHWYVPAPAAKGVMTHGGEGVVTVDYCRTHKIAVQAYSPLKAGDIRSTPNLLNPPPDAPAEVRHIAGLLSDVAGQNNVTSAAVMVAWLLRHPAGITPIIGSTNPEHLGQICAADQVDLSRDDWYVLLSAAAKLQPPSAK